ncbi:hypothetical protein CT0861_07509 [Colletotrichum tofieldiae]|uniref:DUF7888 domain-containing protein n=1 Tax=Colletotrichum tofieldiae TaxID=708197 RepID=A0A166MG20_9PEZI|nr:hypothetical protein CT0861_07509 [Colletotrichum tofieldiae]
MRLQDILFVPLISFAIASPVSQTRSASSIEGSSTVDAEDFRPDWDAIEIEYKAALTRSAQDLALVKRLNTDSANNVAYGKAIYAAGAAAVSQVSGISNWNKAREQFTQLITQIMIDHNPNPKEAVAAICYNKGYDVKDPKGIYGLRSEELSVWPAKTDYDCFYMGKNNAFWSRGDGGTINPDDSCAQEVV